MSRRTGGAKPMQRREGALIGLLCKIFEVVDIAEMSAHCKHVCVCCNHESSERISVATLGGKQQRRQLVHCTQFAYGNSGSGRCDLCL